MLLTILVMTVRLYRSANRFRQNALALIAFLVVATTAQAGIDDAVVQVEGCSGVCVDQAGLVMTARHCDLPETVTIRFKDRTVSATRIYVCHETEGPVIYDCEGAGYPFLPVAASPPQIGERLWSYGYPQVNGQRELRWASGRLLRWSTFEYAGGPFNGNVIGFATGPGWSGGPLLNANAEVCGLLNSADCATSVFISSAAVRQAYATVCQQLKQEHPSDDGQPTLYVFGSLTCVPCRQFKNDYANQESFRRLLESTFAVEFVDVDQQPSLAGQFGVEEVPTFIVPSLLRVTGYQGPEQLLIQLGLQEEDATNSQADSDPEVSESEDTVPDETETSTIVEDEETPAQVQTPDIEPTPDVIQPTSDSGANDRIDRVAGLVEKAVTVATWLGVTGATGGAGGLVLGGIALWRTLRRRRKRPARDPSSISIDKPQVVTVDSPPPPQAIIPETRFAPYERDTFAEAFAWAEAEMARKYPGSVGTMESIKGLIDQFLSGRGVKRET